MVRCAPRCSSIAEWLTWRIAEDRSAKHLASKFPEIGAWLNGKYPEYLRISKENAKNGGVKKFCDDTATEGCERFKEILLREKKPPGDAHRVCEWECSIARD